MMSLFSNDLCATVYVACRADSLKLLCFILYPEPCVSDGDCNFTLTNFIISRSYKANINTLKFLESQLDFLFIYSSA